jgi:hypothetical protein
MDVAAHQLGFEVSAPKVAPTRSST